MKALLIKPPTLYTIRSSEIKEMKGQEGLYPPLGLMYVASYLMHHSDHEVDILDAAAHSMDYQTLQRAIRQHNPEVVGIQAKTFTLVDVLETVKAVKSIDGGIKVVLGGPQPTIYPRETIGLDGVDYCVIGEGEITFTELMTCLAQGKSPRAVDGLIYKEGHEIIQTPPRKLVEELDLLPFPIRPDYKKYFTTLSVYPFMTSLLTSRGCPYRCSFCDQASGKYRIRTAKNVVDEMEECVRIGIREFFIVDDIFTIHRRRAIAICDEIIKRGLKIGFKISARVDNVDKELLEKLRQAGCLRIHYGVESGTQKILDILQKGFTLEQVREAVRMTKGAGIQCYGYFMLGLPYETREDMYATIKFAKEMGFDYCQFALTTAYPATKMYEAALAKGVFDRDYWREFSQNPNKDFQPPHWTEGLSEKEVTELIKFGHRSFYFRPKFILRELARVRSFHEFKTKLRAGIRLRLNMQ